MEELLQVLIKNCVKRIYIQVYSTQCRHDTYKQHYVMYSQEAVEEAVQGYDEFSSENNVWEAWPVVHWYNYLSSNERNICG